MAITKDASQTKRTVQGILNKSYDEDFDILAVELVGYDSDAGVLRRVKTNADGEIQLDTTVNPSFVLTWTSGELTKIGQTISGTAYETNLTWTSGELTAISAWAAT